LTNLVLRVVLAVAVSLSEMPKTDGKLRLTFIHSALHNHQNILLLAVSMSLSLFTSGTLFVVWPL